MPDIHNHLIERLPSADRRRLLDICEPVHLELADVLCEPGGHTQHVHFPVEGFVSLVAMSKDRGDVEVGMIGSEGMLGYQVALGVMRAPLRAVVQGAGSAWKVESGQFREALGRSRALQANVNRYIYVLMAQFATSAACLRFHEIEPRLARWLLMTQDRAHSESFHVTHEFLACMLGVRRAGVTMAAGALQRGGLIEYRRGDITVLDRAGLETAACGCYADDCRQYSDAL